VIQEFLEAGKVRNTHALKGEVKFECWLEGEKPLAGIRFLYLTKKEENGLELLSCRRHGDVFLLTFSGMESVEEASFLKGRTLYVSRKEADPEGKKVYFSDLLGVKLIDADSGTVYGIIREIASRGAGELFNVELENGTERYFPVVSAWIERMDPEEGVFVHAPEGIFD